MDEIRQKTMGDTLPYLTWEQGALVNQTQYLELNPKRELEG